MALRRGFKSEATALASELRHELGLSPLDRLDPFALATHLDVQVLPLTNLTATCTEAEHFITAEPEAFSALTVFEGHRRIIVHNDTHSPPRQHSNIAHELGHCVLHHTPVPALDPLTGCRNYRSEHEQQADWMAGELLVTRPMALATARGRFTFSDALRRLIVSPKMLNWRMNVTGARAQAERERNNGTRTSTRGTAWRAKGHTQ
ncbi:ImmA/IrrE family metallo-endopeptidase [Candidatus Poriferisodalis sp.]|uniref:ImmA/IrrE family metallo-endopeptidase n=1 Tax=Candidatus Poriferisodalis sp. TaxID=3101277 RepID=UPI003B02C576